MARMRARTTKGLRKSFTHDGSAPLQGIAAAMSASAFIRMTDAEAT